MVFYGLCGVDKKNEKAANSSGIFVL